MTTAATPEQIAGATNQTSKGGLFGEAAVNGISNLIAADVLAAQTAATNAAASAASAASLYDQFDDRYLGQKSSDPSEDNDGNALLTGALYFDTTNNIMKVYSGSAWQSTTPTSSEQTNINTLSAAAVVADMAILATDEIVADMAILGSDAIVADMALLATDAIVADMAILGSNDVIADMAILGSNEIVTDMALLGTAANVTAMGKLGNDATIVDMGILATDAIVEDMSILGTDANVTNMATLGASGVVSNITTVSGISGNVTTVAGISGNVTTVAGMNSNVASVVANASNINKVAAIDSNVTTVAGIDSDVTTVAGINAAVTAVNNNASNINTVSGISGNVTTVAGISSNVTSVADNETNINSAVSNSSNINTVAGSISDVTSVAGSVSNVNTVAGSITNVNTTAANIVDVNTFATRYRIASSAPSSSLDVGDLYFDTSSDELKVYKATGWANPVTDLNASNLSSGTVPDARITGTYTGLTNLTASGVGTFGSLDISGDVDVDGTLEADAITVNGTALSSVIQGTTVANATLAATVTVADSTANTNFPVVFHNESNGLLDDTGALRYNPSTETLLAPNLAVAGTTTTVNTVTMKAENAIVFEGATPDNHETTLTIIDPTADRTINLPNESGTIVLKDGSNNIVINELNAVSLDVSGNADIDGTLEADAITVNGATLSSIIQEEATALAIALG
jgi:hypothetical protein